MTPAVLAARPLVGAMTFEETFDAPSGVGYPDFTEVYKYPTWFYFGNPGGVDLTSRAYPGTRNVMLDKRFAPDVAPSTIQTRGCLYLRAWKMTAAQFQKYGGGVRDYCSGMISTKGIFEQAYGYFEVSAKLPDCSGAWPAFWLLPVDKTAQNLGRLAEIDVFEHYGGPLTVMSGDPPQPFVIDRCGRPFSTLHHGVAGAEQAVSNAQKLTTAFPAKLDLAKFHTFGLLWTPDTMTFYCDQSVTLTMPNPGVADPHYLLLSLDVATSAGDPAVGSYPAVFLVDYVRAWELVH